MSRFPRFLSRISIRLLAFNILLVFLPAFGILSLRTYEDQLLKLQERSMVQQARLLAAALAERGAVDGEAAETILTHMQRQFESRIRVVDASYNLLADSSRLGPRRLDGDSDASARQAQQVRESPLYRLGSFLYGFYERILAPPESPAPQVEPQVFGNKLTGREVSEALQGSYGRATRKSEDGRRSLTLYSALPIHSDGEVVGAVVVSKSTFQILRSLYDLRLNTFKVVLASLAVAVVLSLLVSTTIARPISRLRDEANAILDRRGRLKRGFQQLQRRDEIGDLSRALAELTRRLEGHIQFIESFASDVSHEFKNPLASIRNATELLAEVDSQEDRLRFIRMVERDIARLEHLLAGVREITRIDAQLDHQSIEPVDLAPFLKGWIEHLEMRHKDVAMHLEITAHPVVRTSPSRLDQVFENLLDNAIGFSPAGGEVHIDVTASGGLAKISIRDQGPGLPEEHLEKVFTRFFSYRPHRSTGDGLHAGLGLAIVKAIVEGYGGVVSAANASSGGAVFTVTLPAENR